MLDSKGNPGRAVLGALAGMKIGVPAPTVAAYTATQEHQVIPSVEPRRRARRPVKLQLSPGAYLAAKDWVKWRAGRLHPARHREFRRRPYRSRPRSSTCRVSSPPGTNVHRWPRPTSTRSRPSSCSRCPRACCSWTGTVTPNAFGYTDLNMYRYTGDYAYSLAGLAADDVENLVATDDEGAMTLLTGATARAAFVACKDSRSKACPANTAESKRFTWTYDHPKLIDEFDGDVLVASVARVDANAPVVESVKARDQGGQAYRDAEARQGPAASSAPPAPRRPSRTLTWTTSRHGSRHGDRVRQDRRLQVQDGERGHHRHDFVREEGDLQGQGRQVTATRRRSGTRWPTWCGRRAPRRPGTQASRGANRSTEGS